MTPYMEIEDGNYARWQASHLRPRENRFAKQVRPIHRDVVRCAHRRNVAAYEGATVEETRANLQAILTADTIEVQRQECKGKYGAVYGMVWLVVAGIIGAIVGKLVEWLIDDLFNEYASESAHTEVQKNAILTGWLTEIEDLEAADL